jgi:hypothetical protein
VNAGDTTSHSFIIRPCAGSNRTPTPDATKASTRARGSLTTNSSRVEIIANILASAHRANEPKPFFDAPSVTPELLVVASTIFAKHSFPHSWVDLDRNITPDEKLIEKMIRKTELTQKTGPRPNERGTDLRRTLQRHRDRKCCGSTFRMRSPRAGPGSSRRRLMPSSNQKPMRVGPGSGPYAWRYE